ncbi:hypothetical protein FB45DRAFT_877728 [Roridomyces roridus]|uniref:NmrA-like domain-containing protein n=1 Tax=Roridomyces roridus TaxID=1738132 RepID=A0AAD7B1B8_9AGAR|nr:hypothetical protein FB45DRAFT_877728 [Roridomyces roridus]
MPVISIVGATGQQGSAVLRSILSDGTFTPRALTHVQVTNFWDPSVYPGTPNGEREVTQGKNLVDAAEEVGIKFFLWSGTASSKVLSGGKYSDVYHIDTKAAIWEYLKGSGVPCAAVEAPYFAENLWVHGLLAKNADGTGYTMSAPYDPSSTQSFLWVSHDLGPAALTVLKNVNDPERKGRDVLGKAFPIVSFIKMYPELAKRISHVIGKEVVFTPIETCGVHEFDQMYRYQSEFGMYRDLPIPNPELVALGGFKHRVGTLDECIQAEIVPKFK